MASAPTDQPLSGLDAELRVTARPDDVHLFPARTEGRFPVSSRDAGPCQSAAPPRGRDRPRRCRGRPVARRDASSGALSSPLVEAGEWPRRPEGQGRGSDDGSAP